MNLLLLDDKNAAVAVAVAVVVLWRKSAYGHRE
jgi:hypothetical protein